MNIVNKIKRILNKEQTNPKISNNSNRNTNSNGNNIFFQENTYNPEEIEENNSFNGYKSMFDNEILDESYRGHADSIGLKQDLQIIDEKAEIIFRDDIYENENCYKPIISTLDGGNLQEIPENYLYKGDGKTLSKKENAKVDGKEEEKYETMSIYQLVGKIPSEINIDARIEDKENNKLEELEVEDIKESQEVRPDEKINKPELSIKEKKIEEIKKKYKEQGIDEGFKYYENKKDFTKNKYQISVIDKELYKQYQDDIENKLELQGRVYPLIILRVYNIVEFLGYVITKENTVFEPVITEIKISYDKKDLPFLYGLVLEQLFMKFGRFKIDYKLARDLRLVNVLNKVLKCPYKNGELYFGYLSNSLIKRIKADKYPDLANEYKPENVILPKKDKEEYKGSNNFTQKIVTEDYKKKLVQLEADYREANKGIKYTKNFKRHPELKLEQDNEFIEKEKAIKDGREKYED